MYTQKFALVIPTMIRTHTGWEYVDKTLPANAPLFNHYAVSDKFLYVWPEDQARFESFGFKYIDRKVHTENTHTDNYQKWRCNLFLDFCHVMRQAAESTTADYIMWIEDDCIIDPKIFDEVATMNLPLVADGLGGTCIIMQRDKLHGIVTRLLACDPVKNDVPLDWRLDSEKVRKTKGHYGKHIGEFSSQVNKVQRQVQK